MFPPPFTIYLPLFVCVCGAVHMCEKRKRAERIDDDVHFSAYEGWEWRSKEGGKEGLWEYGSRQRSEQSNKPTKTQMTEDKSKAASGEKEVGRKQ